MRHTSSTHPKAAASSAHCIIPTHAYAHACHVCPCTSARTCPQTGTHPRRDLLGAPLPLVLGRALRVVELLIRLHGLSALCTVRACVGICMCRLPPTELRTLNFLVHAFGQACTSPQRACAHGLPPCLLGRRYAAACLFMLCDAACVLTFACTCG